MVRINKIILLVLFMVALSSFVSADITIVNNASIDCSNSNYLFCDDIKVQNNSKWYVPPTCVLEPTNTSYACNMNTIYTPANNLRINITNYPNLTNNSANWCMEIKARSGVNNDDLFYWGLNDSMASTAIDVIAGQWGNSLQIGYATQNLNIDVSGNYRQRNITWRICRTALNTLNWTIYNETSHIIANKTSAIDTYFGDTPGFILGGLVDGYKYIDYLLIWGGSYSNAPYLTAGGTTSKPLVQLKSPTDTSINNTYSIGFIYNVTDTAGYIVNCSLYHNYSSIWKLNTTNNSLVTNNSNNYFNNITFSDGNFAWNVECYDNNSNFSFATANFTFTIDTSSPTLAYTSLVNNSIYFKNNITSVMNFSDNNMIWGYNISIDGVEINHTFNVSATSVNYTLNYNTSGLSPGNHNLLIWYADAHTALEIDSEAYQPSTCLLKDCLIYDFVGKSPGSINIKQKGINLLDTWTTQEQKDRYTFSFKPGTTKTSYTFTVEAQGNIYIVNAPKTKYRSWIVYDNHWLDFYPYTDIVYKQIDKNTIEVTINNVDSKLKELNFESIGDLNIVTKTFVFATTNANVTYADPVPELVVQDITLSINTTSIITNTNANLTYNGTLKSVSKTSYTSYDKYVASFITSDISSNSTLVFFNWNYSINSTGGTETGLLGFNQTVQAMLIDNCSQYNITVLNFTTYTEAVNPYRWNNTDINAYVELWLNSSYKQYFNLSLKGRYSYAWCIFNPNQTFNIYSQLEYTNNDDASSTYNKETYYLYNMTVSNTTKYVSLYNTPNATAVLFSVSDQYDDPVVGAYIWILSYDFGTNTYVTTEILKTDENGDAIGNVILTTNWYKFLIYYDNELVLSSEPTKIITATRNFRVSFGTDYYDNWDIINGINGVLTYTNDTGNFAFTFSNPIGTDVTACLNITQRTALKEIYVNSSCLTASSGTILVNIGTAPSGYYIGKATIMFNPTILWGFIDVNFDKGYKQWGKDGVFAVTLLRMVMATIGIWNPMVAILLIAVTDIFMLFLGVYYVSWSTMAVYIILMGIVIWRLNSR